MLSPEDLKQIAEKGITEEQVATQLEEFKKGFPFLKLEAAAGIGRGVIAPADSERADYIAKWEPIRQKARRS